MRFRPSRINYVVDCGRSGPLDKYPAVWVRVVCRDDEEDEEMSQNDEECAVLMDEPLTVEERFQRYQVG